MGDPNHHENHDAPTQGSGTTLAIISVVDHNLPYEPPLHHHHHHCPRRPRHRVASQHPPQLRQPSRHSPALRRQPLPRLPDPPLSLGSAVSR
ncbi:hypothetical protein Ahy_B04g072804 isoform A [Arachis hypogaea]|uniref:Uncharacterized protein n=1 Tax=Arachis hypogaea TaxID=3818 RepID=A0A444ZNW0_ARAHY|nr:hypothetical protein Ahy_B04g072804 isoform A [Arachis hypogaea]